MSNKFLCFGFISSLLPVIATAGSIEATNEQPSLNTNPHIELYPGQAEYLSEMMEMIQVEKVARLLLILKSIRNDENAKAIQMLEEDLVAETSILKSHTNTSDKALDILQQVSGYHTQFTENSAPNKARQPRR